MLEYHDTDELRHYGVIGMKWGIRRGNASKAYTKASKKLDKLDAKIEKRTAEFHKKARKAETARRSNREKADAKARDASRKLAKATIKGKKWVDKMEKAFKNTEISLTQEQRAKQKRYGDYVTSRYTSRY